jgi:hypothetical protein
MKLSSVETGAGFAVDDKRPFLPGVISDAGKFGARTCAADVILWIASQLSMAVNHGKGEAKTDKQPVWLLFIRFISQQTRCALAPATYLWIIRTPHLIQRQVDDRE